MANPLRGLPPHFLPETDPPNSAPPDSSKSGRFYPPSPADKYPNSSRSPVIESTNPNLPPVDHEAVKAEGRRLRAEQIAAAKKKLWEALKAIDPDMFDAMLQGKTMPKEVLPPIVIDANTSMKVSTSGEVEFYDKKTGQRIQDPSLRKDFGINAEASTQDIRQLITNHMNAQKAAAGGGGGGRGRGGGGGSSSGSSKLDPSALPRPEPTQHQRNLNQEKFVAPDRIKRAVLKEYNDPSLKRWFKPEEILHPRFGPEGLSDKELRAALKTHADALRPGGHITKDSSDMAGRVAKNYGYSGNTHKYFMEGIYGDIRDGYERSQEKLRAETLRRAMQNKKP